MKKIIPILAILTAVVVGTLASSIAEAQVSCPITMGPPVLRNAICNLQAQINNIQLMPGPPGPQGPPGVDGMDGQDGAPGPPGLITTYVVRGEGGQVPQTVFCESGDVATGYGFNDSNEGGSPRPIGDASLSEMMTGETPIGYVFDGIGTPYTICADITP